MSKAKYTPGPWEYRRGTWGDHDEDAEERGFTIYLNTDPDDCSHEVHQLIAYADSLYPKDGNQYEEAEANARLYLHRTPGRGNAGAYGQGL